jgi:hypothetical protein
VRGNWRAGIRWIEIELSSGYIQFKGNLVICRGGVFDIVEGAKPFPSPLPGISDFCSPFPPIRWRTPLIVVWYAFAFAFLIYISETVSGLGSANFLGTTPFTYHTRVFPLLISRASIDTVLLDQRPNTRYLWISIPIALEIKISFAVQLMPLHSCG